MKKIFSPRQAASALILLAGMALCSRGASAEGMPVSVTVGKREPLSYSGYAGDFDRQYSETRLRITNKGTSPADRLRITLECPEGYALDSKGRRVIAYEKAGFIREAKLNIRLYPTKTPEKSEMPEVKISLRANGEEERVYSLPFEVLYSSDEYSIDTNVLGEGSYDFLFSEKMFEKDPSGYDTELAKASFAMAVSAFSSDSGEDNWNSDIRRDGNIGGFFSEIGMKGFRSYKYDEPLSNADDTAAVAIAGKKIKAGGKEKYLVAAAVRGGGYGAEWAGNMNTGENGVHTGFSKAGTGVAAKVERFILDKNKEGLDTVVWITGYSRGGAVSNCAAAELCGDGFTVYGYTFATPGVTVSPEKCSVHNIINRADLVPMVPPESWGFKRNGTDHFFGSRNEDTDRLLSLFEAAIPSRETYVKYYMDPLAEAMKLCNSERDMLADESTAKVMGGAFLAAFNTARVAGEVSDRLEVSFDIFSRSAVIKLDGKPVELEGAAGSLLSHMPEAYADGLSKVK